MQRLLTEILDLIFPPSEDEIILREAAKQSVAKLYQPGKIERTQYISEYSQTVTRIAITENKFHNNHLASRILGQLIDEWANKQTGPTIFIPIPLGKKRLRERGHNQVETVLKAAYTKLDIRNDILMRSVETLPQSHLNKTKRQQNMKNVFSLSKKELFLEPGTQIVLVDDVITTGATMNAARATLAPHLPPNTTLTCLAIAH